ncbi:UNVERIFIED_CONTAM: hypothetical protein PYX00_000101 [Menopon gallinae]|uniref:Uncharacterized protein n=1 Tax=Menopon gallinae TaxID=328185 RepID=A0AAW2I8H4_9NEOP
MARKRLLRCGITPPALPKSEVQIDESLRRGHILRTSMSDICEYKNGSLIRLYGKSGWTLYTRKLFLTGLDLNMPCKGPGGLQYFTVYPARTEVNSRSFVGVTINNGFLEANRYLTATRYIPRSGKSPSNIYLVRDGIFGPGNPDLSEPEMRRRREREIFPDDSLALRQQTIINRNVKWEVDSQNRFCTCRRGTKRKTQENAARMPYERQKSSAVLFVFENVNSKPSEPSTEGDNSKGHHSEVTRRGTFHDRPSKTRASRQIENDGLTDLLRTLGRENDDVELIEREIRSEYGDYEDNLPKHCSGRHSAAYQGDKRRSTIPLKRSAVGENISMKDIGRKTRWLRTDNVNPIERNEPKQVKGRCACCHCRSNHVCRPHVPEEPVTGLQKILRNIAFTGWNLGTKKPVSRTSSKKSVKKRDERDGTPETVEDGPSSHRKITSMDRKIPPGADVLDDISIQRHRLTECENLLRQFELKLDDVTRQSEAYSCRCDGADVRPRHDSVCRCPDSEGRDQEESSRRYGDHSDSKNEPGPCRCEEKENTVSRYVTTRGHASDSHRQQMKAVPSSNSAHHHTSSLNPVSSSNAAHHGGPGIISLPPRIEIISERTACTCEKCRNIHYIEKHYLPTALIKNALKQDSRSQAQQDTHWDREKDRDRDREREIEQRWSQKIKTPPKKLKNRTMSTLDQYTEEKYAQADDSWDALDDGRRNSGDSYRSFTGDPSKKGKIKSCMCSSQLRAIEDRLKALEQRRHESSRDRTSEDIASLSELSRKKSSSDRYTTVTSTSSVKTNSKTNSTMKYSSSPSEHSPPHHAPSPPTPPRKAKKEDKKKDGKKEDKKFKGKKKEEKKEKKEKEKKEKKKKGKKDKKDKTRKVASLEAIRSETDVEVRTLVVSCQNMGMFEKGDPTAKSTCRCMEGKYCPFKYFGADDPGIQKNIFFLTNLDLPARWSRLYGPMNYEYCKTSSYLANRRLKSEKRRESPRDWHNVRAALASFLRSLRLRKRKIFHRRKKMECIGESCSRIGSDSEDSLLNDCSRSSMPLQKRSFHISLDGPRPIRPTKEKWRTSSKRRTPSEKKRRKKSRKKRV